MQLAASHEHGSGASAEGGGPPDPLALLDVALARRRAGRPLWDWFERPIRTHHEAQAGASSEPIPPRDAGRAVADALATAAPARRRMIYIHIPFCPAFCSFCAFYRTPCDAQQAALYARALRAQIMRYRSTPWAEAGPVDAIYFGGGTPTALPADELAGLVEALRDGFDSARAEVTVESRIGGVDAANWRRLRRAGVTRVSFGVQTFDSALRRRIGRRNDFAGVRAALAECAAAGFDCLSADLIYNLPGQTLDSWERDFEALFAQPLSGCSVYALIPFARSPLIRRIAAGQEPPLGGLEREYAYFVRMEAAFARENAWRRMSARHYGKPPRETNVYNRNRATSADILAIGAGAGGRIGGISYMAPHDLEAWMRGQMPNGDGGASESAGETVAFAARRPERDASTPDLASLAESLLPAADAARLPRDGAAAGVLERLAALGLVETAGADLALTQPGRFWSYTVAWLLNLASNADAAAEPSPMKRRSHHR